MKTVDLFYQINRCRQGTGYGPGPLQPDQLKAYCELIDERVEPWEVRLFFRLDQAYLEEVASKLNEET